MSMRNGPPAQESRRVNFAQPSGNNVAVIGTDNLTTNPFLQLAQANYMLRVIFNPANTNQVGFLVLRRDGKEIRRWPTSLLRADLIAGPYPGFPLGVGPGTIQLVYINTAGTLGAVSVDIMWQHSLVPVRS